MSQDPGFPGMLLNDSSAASVHAGNMVVLERLLWVGLEAVEGQCCLMFMVTDHHSVKLSPTLLVSSMLESR